MQSVACLSLHMLGVCFAPKTLATAAHASCRRDVIAASIHGSEAARPAAPGALSRRAALVGAAAAALLLPQPLPAAAEEAAAAGSGAAAIRVLEDTPGSGSAEARRGDLVMVHYVGLVAADGKLFDSTLGGEVRGHGGGLLPPAQRMARACCGLRQG